MTTNFQENIDHWASRCNLYMLYSKQYQMIQLCVLMMDYWVLRRDLPKRLVGTQWPTLEKLQFTRTAINNQLELIRLSSTIDNSAQHGDAMIYGNARIYGNAILSELMIPNKQTMEQPNHES